MGFGRHMECTPEPYSSLTPVARYKTYRNSMNTTISTYATKHHKGQRFVFQNKQAA